MVLRATIERCNDRLAHRDLIVHHIVPEESQNRESTAPQVIIPQLIVRSRNVGPMRGAIDFNH
jgi:hypothetical protein